MKAIVYHQFNNFPKEALQMVYDHPVPRINATEVLVKVIASSVNQIDWKFMKGNFSLVINNFPIVPCFDVAGVVMAIGEKVRRIRVGDSVYGMTKPVGNGKTNCGACAEYVAISERCVAVMPKTTSYLEAASFPLIALTTVQGIGRYVRDGTKILIIGGSSGVGSFAVQYAKAKGCYVSSTCSTKNLEMVSGLGADRVIDYTKENWGDLLAGGEYDVIFDCVGGIENWNSSSRVLKKKETLLLLLVMYRIK